jgi:hypothetical protein
MKGHAKRFTKDKVRAAREEGRFEDLATWGLQKGSIEWVAEKCMPCLQRHFNDLEEHTPEELAARNEMTRQLNEQALETERRSSLAIMNPVSLLLSKASP